MASVIRAPEFSQARTRSFPWNLLALQPRDGGSPISPLLECWGAEGPEGWCLRQELI